MVERISALQRRILAWLWAHEQRYQGTMAASYTELVHALAHDKGNLSHSLRTMERKGTDPSVFVNSGALTKTPPPVNENRHPGGRPRKYRTAAERR